MSNPDGVSLLAFLKKESDITAMKGFAEEHGLGEDCVFEGNITDATEYLGTHEPPNLLVVEIPIFNIYVAFNEVSFIFCMFSELLDDIFAVE